MAEGRDLDPRLPHKLWWWQTPWLSTQTLDVVESWTQIALSCSWSLDISWPQGSVQVTHIRMTPAVAWPWGTNMVTCGDSDSGYSHGSCCQQEGTSTQTVAAPGLRTQTWLFGISSGLESHYGPNWPAGLPHPSSLPWPPQICLSPKDISDSARPPLSPTPHYVFAHHNGTRHWADLWSLFLTEMLVCAAPPARS